MMGMLTAGRMNKQIARHFQACEFNIPSWNQDLSDGQFQKLT